MAIPRYAICTWCAVALAAAAAVAVSQPAAAKCYDNLQNEIPCPKTDYRLKQPTATGAPKPTETATPQAVGQQALVVTPDAEQLAMLCANLPGGGVGSGNPSPDTLPAPPQPGPSPYLLGGGGLLLGILIGLLVPAVSRSLHGGIIGPVDAGINGDGSASDWHKKTNIEGDAPTLEFDSGEPKSLSPELIFDEFEAGKGGRSTIESGAKLEAGDLLSGPPMKSAKPAKRSTETTDSEGTQIKAGNPELYDQSIQKKLDDSGT